MKVTLFITDGPMKGEKRVFEEADIFIVGRMDDCHYFLSDDPYLSRHHFMLEINPPDITIQDLGSLNGTFINEERYGGRTASGSPENAGPEGKPIPLNDGDLIKCGKTEMKVAISDDAESEAGDFEPQQEVKDKAEEMRKEEKEPPEPVPKNKPVPEPPEIPPQIKKNKPPENQKPPLQAALFRPPPDRTPRPSPPPKKAVPDAAVNELIQRLLRNALAGKEEKLPEIQGYTLIKKLGAGGFGAVYLAKENRSGKKVALKMMLQEKVPSKKAIALFEREVEVNRRLRHKHIISVEKYFRSTDLHCFALEYMDGGSVWDLMRQKGVLDFQEALPIMLQTLEGLAFAHKKKIIHRDIKPPNILLSGNSEKRIAKLSDFGLAKNFARAGMTRANITLVGDVCGSPPYMAPEHITNYRFVKAPTDVFEIAATFYHMLTGHIVWDLSGGINCFQAILQGTIKPMVIYNPNIPHAIRLVIEKALNRDPEKRFKNAAGMLKALKKAL